MERMIDPVLKTATENPRKIALSFMGKKTTYGSFASQVHTAAKALTALGLREGDVMCVVMPNMPQAIVMIYAANLIGVRNRRIHQES